MASVLTQSDTTSHHVGVGAQTEGRGTPESIVFLGTSAHLGGAERVLLDMVASLRDADPGCRIVVITSGNGSLIDEVRALGAKAIVLPYPTSLASLGDASVERFGSRFALVTRTLLAAPAVMSYLRALRGLLRQLTPDVIHSNGAKMHLLAAYASRGIAPVVWHLHDYVGSRPFMRRALRAAVSRCAAVVANSESVALDARSVFGRVIPIHTILNAVDLDRFTVNGSVLDLDSYAALAPAGDRIVRVGLVGTFAKWKGHQLFFTALETLPSDLPLRAYVIGGPLYETQGSQYSMDELRRSAASICAAGRIVFTGHVSDVPAAMRALDIVVHASTEPEPFGLVIAEAMACGRAVITSGSGGALELVEDEQDALVTRSGDAGQLGAAIARLVRDAGLRAKLGAAAQQSASRRFDRRRLAETLAPIYRQAVEARQP